MTTSDIDKSWDPSPLTPAVFHILLALTDGQKHGYAIMKQVDKDGGGFLRMAPGSLYASLQGIAATGFVEDLQTADDERGGYYWLTRNVPQALQGDEFLRHLARTAPT